MLLTILRALQLALLRMTTFKITLRIRDGGDGIRALRAALKLLLRRFGLRAIRVEQTTDTD